jgi:hypothetical protein
VSGGESHFKSPRNERLIGFATIDAAFMHDRRT